MTNEPSPFCVAHPDMEIPAAARRICRENVPALPVLEHSGTLAGIITRRDLCRFIAEYFEQDTGS